jgi:hypothetical protein
MTFRWAARYSGHARDPLSNINDSLQSRHDKRLGSQTRLERLQRLEHIVHFVGLNAQTLQRAKGVLGLVSACRTAKESAADGKDQKCPKALTRSRRGG